MKKALAIPFEIAQAAALPWALLFAELLATLLLFSSGRVPAVLVRSLQIFLRF